MSADEWLARWREGRIGFHREAVHPALERYWAGLGLAEDAKVLVPLCGKSRDMRWLAANGHPIMGVELSPLAIEQFVAQQDLPIQRYRRDGFDCTRQGRIELWCGDFFHFQVDHAVELGGFYDRAALIALPPPTRQRYAHHLAQLLLPGVRGLLITLAHDDPERGPPYSVDAAEVERLLVPNFEIEPLESAVGEDGLRESVWALTRRGPRG